MTRSFILGFCLLGFSLTACSPSSLIDVDVPPGTDDPRAYNTADGALARYRGLIDKFRLATSGGAGQTLSFIPASGLLSDELNTARTIPNQFAAKVATSIIDSRNVSEESRSPEMIGATGQTWGALHQVRIAAMDAIGALRKYAPQSPQDRIGHAFALWGLSEIMLAELYCSGIPLSTIEFEGEVRYANGSTTEEVYTHAVQLMDSALVYATDSMSYRYLAMVGKGWALLGLKQYEAAAAAVEEVPTDFVYQNLHALNESNANFTFYQQGRSISQGNGSVSDLEGGRGLPYRSANDPRVQVDLMPPDEFDVAAVGYQFRKIAGDAPGRNPVTIASGIEARLIRAEAELAAGSSAWLTTLNALRASEGGVAGLTPLTDPGTPAARVDTLFKERAFWLFLTGRRLGDMRRLVRQYGRSVTDVFPQGAYPSINTGAYGSSVNLVPPITERDINTAYKGCENRNA
jgi:hypothetical protein